jgi:hypothetical protein
LTDHPEFFADLKNVLPLKHQFGGVRACYHDKRHVIAAVLDRYDVCIFLDSDCRLIEAINFQEIIKAQSFILVPSARNLWEKLSGELNEKQRANAVNSAKRRVSLLQRVASELNVTLQEVTFVQEIFFVVNKQFGDHAKFLRYWDYAARYLTLRLFEFSEGSSIGICAAAAGCHVQDMANIPSWLFKDLFQDHRNKSQKQIDTCEKMAALRRSIESEYRVKKSDPLWIPRILTRYFRVLFRQNATHPIREPANRF